MTKQRGIIRKRELPFAQVSNYALRDKTLSLKAKGLYALIQSYITIPNFILYKDYLMKQCREGRDAFNGAWKELKDAGYLIQYKTRDEKGSFVYDYELLDYPEPDVKSPYVENPPMDSAHMEDPYVYNNTYSNNKDKNNTYSNNTKSSSSISGKKYDGIKINSNSFEEEDCYTDLYNSYYQRCLKGGYNISLSDIKTLFSLYNKTSVCQVLEKILRGFVSIDNPYGYIAKSIESREKKDNIYIGYKKDDDISNLNSTPYDIEKELGYL